MPIKMPAELILVGDFVSTMTLAECPEPARLRRVEEIGSIPNPIDGGHFFTLTFAGGDSLHPLTGQMLPVNPVVDMDEQVRCCHGRALHGGFFGDEPQHDGAHCWPDEDPACDDEAAKVRKQRQALAILAREATYRAA